MKEMVPAIVLGCHKLGLGVIKALGFKGVPVIGVYYNPKDMGYVSRYVNEKYFCPFDPDDDPDKFITFLMDEVSKKWHGSVLIPSNDAVLIPVSKNKKRLEKYFKVVACDWEITEKYIDKKYTYDLAEKIGVPAPKTFLPKTIQDALSNVDKIGYPCLLKPSIGHSFYEKLKKKMIFIENKAQLEEAFVTTHSMGIELMLQEFIPGNDKSGINYNSFFLNHEAVVEFTAQKMRLSPLKTGFPRVVISKHIPEVYEPGRKILKALDYEGFSCMEFKLDSRNGIYKLMEVNGRQNLSTLLSVKAGINFPYLTYQYAAYQTIPEPNRKFKEGIYWIDLEKDIFESLKSSRIEQYPLLEYLKPYFKPHVFSVLAITDIFPFMKRMLDLFKSGLKMLLKK